MEISSANKERRYGVPQLYQQQWAHDLQLDFDDAISKDFPWIVNVVETDGVQAKVQVIFLYLNAVLVLCQKNEQTHRIYIQRKCCRT